MRLKYQPLVVSTRANIINHNMNEGRGQLWWFPRLHHKQGEEEYKEHRQVRLDFLLNILKIFAFVVLN